MVGLSARSKVGPLLKTIGNKTRNPKKPEPDVDAPPLSTDDESEGDNAGYSLTHRSSPKKGSRLTDMIGSDSDTSFTERHSKANIVRTTFSTKRSSDNVSRKDKAKRTKVSDDDEAKPSLSKNKLSLSKRSITPSSSGEHFKDRHGFVKTKASKSTYGKRSSVEPLSKQEKSKSLRVPSPEHSPKKSNARLRVPSKELSSSPQEPKPTLKLKGFTSSYDSDPEDEISPEVRALLKSKPGATYKPFSKKSKAAKARRDLLRSPSPPRAVFKMPSEFPDPESVENTNAEADAEDMDLEQNDTELEPAPKATTPEAEKPAVCPWCNAEVDAAQLEKFSRGKKRLTVQMQTKFCALHKKHTAKQQWKSRGYPEISWNGLEKRFAKYSDELLGIVQGQQSHFRKMHEDKIKSGKSRTMRQDDNLNPGYYGPQGLDVMSDFLVKEFSDTIKERAVIDRVISGRGSAAFIQSVLVAELALRMIMEDMSVDKEQALSILEESRDIGETVYED